MMLAGRETAKLVCFIVLPRKRVAFVVNLTHEGSDVQFSSVRKIGIFQLPRPNRLASKLSHQNTAVYGAS